MYKDSELEGAADMLCRQALLKQAMTHSSYANEHRAETA